MMVPSSFCLIVQVLLWMARGVVVGAFLRVGTVASRIAGATTITNTDSPCVLYPSHRDRRHDRDRPFTTTTTTTTARLESVTRNAIDGSSCDFYDQLS
mmetsp:Transcript_9535/g.16677  ORF Transcript_9535/g.16677 Transcript_9535/m.16677 type:complete len:98 (-) Transcript_9535:523-816(-)